MCPLSKPHSILSLERPFKTGWWFQAFYIFHNIWDNHSHWLIFFKMVKTTNQKMSDSKKSLYVPETLFSRGPYLKTPWSQWRFGSLGKSTVSEGWKSTSTPCLITKGYAEYTWKLSYSSYIWLPDAPPLFTQTCKVETDKKPRSWQDFLTVHLGEDKACFPLCQSWIVGHF
jgi:hypothetical protein